MDRLDPAGYTPNTDLPSDDERIGGCFGTLERVRCPYAGCGGVFARLDDLLDDAGRASGTAIVRCPSCAAPVHLQTEIVVHAFTARRKDESQVCCTKPPPGWTCSRERGHEGPCAAWPATHRRGGAA